MKIFITGVTGYIGGSIAKYLVNKGYSVTGLVRDPTKLAALKNLGVTPVLGNLADSILLEQMASKHDAVINAANADDINAVRALLSGLVGSGKPFIHTSGSSIVGDDAEGMTATDQQYADDDFFIPIPSREARVAINNEIRLVGIQKGVKAMVIAPSMIYGESLGLPVESDQIPKLIAISKKYKAGVYIGKGVNRWSNVHIEDLAQLYHLALLKGCNGAMFYAENGEVCFKDIANAISYKLEFNGETKSISLSDAMSHYGEWARYAIASNSRIKANNARVLLGWQPKFNNILEWIK